MARKMLVLFLVQLTVIFINGQSRSFFRKDYTYLEATRSFYKIHTITRTWSEAKKRCEDEGTSMFYPEDEVETMAVIDLWNKTQPFPSIFIGISDLLVKGDFMTLDGRPITDVYHNWAPGEPNDAGGIERCMYLRRAGTLNDVECDYRSPFICKKSLEALEWNRNCNTPRTSLDYQWSIATGCDCTGWSARRWGTADTVCTKTAEETEAQKKRFYRPDYMYLDATQAFYKIHTFVRTWSDAKKRCELEGARMFYPENKKEANVILDIWKKTQTFPSIFVGASDLLSKENFETIDGRPITDVYHNWAPGEPNDAGGIERCMYLRRAGTLNDVECDYRSPFICKKSLDALEWNNDCDMPGKDYIFNADLGRCYKFHQDPQTWNEAFDVCTAEQSHLAIINSQAEADHMVKMYERYSKDYALGVNLYGVAYLGVHKDGDAWKAIDGTSLEESGYSTWGTQHLTDPERTPNGTCGAVFRTGELNAVPCEYKLFYICEHEIGSAKTIENQFKEVPSTT